jgi:VanZ family protein
MTTTQDLSSQQALQLGCARWSNRILLLAVLGIAYLTLFPFDFQLVNPHPPYGSPLLLGDSVKIVQAMDFFLNVLLFIPFGFGVAGQVCKRGGKLWTAGLLAYAAGVATSYTVELLQFYIPSRDSGWEDLISNGLGSFAGFLLWALLGAPILTGASHVADAVDRWLTPRRTAALLAIYFAAWFVVSAVLQRESRLSDWNPLTPLVVGNDAAGENPWNGRIAQLQFWNRALSEAEIRSIASKQGAASRPAKSEIGAGLVASYDFSGDAPYRDVHNSSPALDWTPAPPLPGDARDLKLNATAWLSSGIPAENLVQQIRNSNQFTVHLLCQPAAVHILNGRIVSLSNSAGDVNFHLRAEGSSLFVWIFDPLSASRSMLAWPVQAVFEPGKMRDLVVVYDGSDALIYLDGIRSPNIYRLSPGASLMRNSVSVRTSDLDGAILVYETLVFLPAGLLVGLEAAATFRRKMPTGLLLAAGLLLPAILHELLLMELSGRRMWPENIAWSFVFGIAGALLMNADRKGIQNSIPSSLCKP